MIVLASASAARRDLLKNAGLDVECVPADLDEKALVQSLQGQSEEDITLELAKAKALHVARRKPEALVIGADQTLCLDGKILAKAGTKEEALGNLKTLRGRAHRLISAVCAAEGENILWTHIAQATLTMKNHDDAFLESYARTDPDALTRCVGAYRIEGPGAWLFEKIEGDLFTVMGLPLLPLLDYLHTRQDISL